MRFWVEQPFGQAKGKHSLGRCPYRGPLNYGFQAFLSFLVINLKRIVRLLTGLAFRELAKGCRKGVLRPVYAHLPWA